MESDNPTSLYHSLPFLFYLNCDAKNTCFSILALKIGFPSKYVTVGSQLQLRYESPIITLLYFLDALLLACLSFHSSSQAAHLFWGIWALIQSYYSEIDFDFLG